jgi:hypothetical protein
MAEENVKEAQLEEIALEEVAYGNMHALNVLIDLLIEKGVINEREFRDKLNEEVEESPELDEVKIDVPDEKPE